MNKKLLKYATGIILITLISYILTSCKETNTDKTINETSTNKASSNMASTDITFGSGLSSNNRTELVENTGTSSVLNEDIRKVINKHLLLEISGDDKYAIWDFSKGVNESKINFGISDKLKNIPIVLGLDSPNGTKAIVVIGDTGYNLITLSNNLLESAFDEYGELKDGYFVQTSKFDFDRDGTNEIILSVGNKTTELGISVFKYIGDNFFQMGYIESQAAQAYIDIDGTVQTYDNTGRLISKYKWNGKEFARD